MIFWFIPIISAKISSEINVGIIISKFTPESAVSELQSLKSLSVFKVFYVEVSDLGSTNYEEFDFFVDFTYTTLYNQQFVVFQIL